MNLLSSKTIAKLWMALLVLSCARATRAQGQPEFSADVVTTYSESAGKLLSGQHTGRFYASKGRTRSETYRNGELAAVTIVDTKNQTEWQLMPKQKIAMDYTAMYQKAQESVAQAMPQSELDPNNPCAVFKQGTCTKVGAEQVNGHSTVKWQVKGNDGQMTYFWVDPGLRFSIKTQTPIFVSEFRNIKLGAQPDSLFQVPPDYRKMTQPGLR
jgi:hypothetical protein